MSANELCSSLKLQNKIVGNDNTSQIKWAQGQTLSQFYVVSVAWKLLLQASDFSLHLPKRTYLRFGNQ